MYKDNIFIMIIFYVVLTSVLITIWVKEKAIGKYIREKRDKFGDKVAGALGQDSTPMGTFIRNSIKVIETIATALILVLIIQKFYIGNFLVPTGSMADTIIPGDRLFGNMVVYKFKKPEVEDIIVFREPSGNKDLYTKRMMALPGDQIEINGGSLYRNGKKVEERRYSDLGRIAGEKWVVPKKGDKLKIVAGDAKIFSYQIKDMSLIQRELNKNSAEIEGLLPNIEFYINGQRTGMILDYIHQEDVVKELLETGEYEGVIKEDYYLALGDNTDHSYDSRFWGFVAEHRLKGKALVRFFPLNRISLLK